MAIKVTSTKLKSGMHIFDVWDDKYSDPIHSGLSASGCLRRLNQDFEIRGMALMMMYESTLNPIHED